MPIPYKVFCPNCGKELPTLYEGETAECTCGCTTELMPTNPLELKLVLRVK